ncbi:recombinase family protein [Kocuria aegyptia]|uniref:Resolvase/invertase-type recombinase catalytic domain-containing protein n=1 Tax=Kocuria aegyptia TaxID=330943 RepID=A0ABN2KGQ5_9MICC
MAGKKVGYARDPTIEQDLTVQRKALLHLEVAEDRICVDHGPAGAHRTRPGLREAMAACWPGDTLVVTKLDHLARSVPDARGTADELTTKGVVPSPGGSQYDPTDPVGRLLFNVLSMVAEFESDLIRMRTHEGMSLARAKGRLRGKQPKLSILQRRHLMALHEQREHNRTEPAELFGVSRTMIYPTIQRETTKIPH